MSQTIGYVLFAHGSRLETANDSIRTLAAKFAEAGNLGLVDVAFLDCAPPSLETTTGRLVDRGASKIVVIPYFLTMGRHAAEDLPRIAAEASRIHNVDIRIAGTMEGHPGLLRILLERASEALSVED